MCELQSFTKNTWLCMCVCACICVRLYVNPACRIVEYINNVETNLPAKPTQPIRPTWLYIRPSIGGCKIDCQFDYGNIQSSQHVCCVISMDRLSCICILKRVDFTETDETSVSIWRFRPRSLKSIGTLRSLFDMTACTCIYVCI